MGVEELRGGRAVALVALLALVAQCAGARQVPEPSEAPPHGGRLVHSLSGPTGPLPPSLPALSGVRSGAEAWWDDASLEGLGAMLLGGPGGGGGRGGGGGGDGDAARRATPVPPLRDNAAAAGAAAGATTPPAAPGAPPPRHKPLLPLDARDSALFALIAGTLALAAGGGIGGGAIYMPLLVALGGFAPGAAVALSNLAILGGAAANLAINVTRQHPRAPGRPLIDWTLILVGWGWGGGWGLWGEGQAGCKKGFGAGATVGSAPLACL
jgi:hypothetical protein